MEIKTTDEKPSENKIVDNQSSATQNKDKVTPEVAKKEVDSWLDYKKVKPKKRENLDAQIEVFVDAIVAGTLVLDHQNFVFKHTLSFPLENSKGDITVTSVNYKPRLSVKQINAKMKGIKPTDADARVLGYIAALTDEATEVLTRFDSEDSSIAQAFATFFL